MTAKQLSLSPKTGDFAARVASTFAVNVARHAPVTMPARSTPLPQPHLHPALRAILDAEIAAGNTIREVGGGWPRRGSVFIRLRKPFQVRPEEVPAGVAYVAVNDPHWWREEYSIGEPPHLLVC